MHQKHQKHKKHSKNKWYGVSSYKLQREHKGDPILTNLKNILLK